MILSEQQAQAHQAELAELHLIAALADAGLLTWSHRLERYVWAARVDAIEAERGELDYDELGCGD